MARLLLWLTLLPACRDSHDSGALPVEKEMAEVLGCNPDLDVFHGVSVSSTGIANVPLVSWESSEEVQAYVVTDVGREDYLMSPVSEQAAMSGSVEVRGIPFLRETWGMVVAQTDEGLACSEPQYSTPATLDPGIPEVSLTSLDPEQAEGGYTVLGLITDGASFVVIVNELGEYVWAKAMGLGVVSRAVFAQDSATMLYLTWAESVEEAGTIHRLGFDGEVEESFEITGAHTDFVQLPDGGMAAIGWDLRDIQDGEGVNHRVLGDSIVEVDAEGNQRVVWSVFDVYQPDLSLVYGSASLGPDTDLVDWSHGNGLAYDEVEDDYLISLFGLGSLVRVDRQSGETQWILSDSHGDFSSNDDEPLIRGTHSVETLDGDRILLFNRNVPNPLDDVDDEVGELCSEALEVQLDPKTGEASRVWDYASDECLLVVYFGEAIRLDGGNTLVIFSSSGQVSETTDEGETVWEIQLDVGGAFGFGGRRSSLY